MPFVQIHDTALHFESIRVDKSTEDIILIFLHEALGSIPQWRGFPQALCSALEMDGLTYERQGHGQSGHFSKQRDHRYLHHYAWHELPAFLDTVLSSDQKVILIGHSDGGSIALLYGAKYPKRVKAIITIAAHVINEPETIAGIGPAVNAFKAGKLEKLRSFHGEKTDALFYAWANTWSSDDFANWDITHEISTITAPVLAIQGTNDQYGTSKQLELIQSALKGYCETKLIPDCGHHPHLEQKTEVIRLIRQFTLSNLCAEH